MDFLKWDEPDEDNFAQDVRIVLVAADFSRELTTSVMWLNERDLDIRCVRIRPYMDGGRVLVDVQQVIPLPEAQDYIVRIREKAVKERQDRIDQGGRKALRKRFWDSLLQLSADKTALFKNVSPSPDSWIATGSGISGLHYVYWLRQHTSSVRFIIEGDKATNKLRFDWLYERREQVEKVFGGPLRWDRCDDLKQSRLYVELSGGYRDPEENWPQTHAAMVDAMCRIVEAISPFIQQLRQIEADSATAV